METEIDLLKYLRILLKRWYWIVGSGIAFALIAVVVTSRPTIPVYRATALVGYTRTRLEFDLADDFRTIDPVQNISRAFPELATSDEVLQRVAEAVTEKTGESFTLSTIRGMSSAQSGEDEGLLRLTVTSTDPETAALVVNEWADLFSAQAGLVFGIQPISAAQEVEQQLKVAEANLMEQNATLLSFREGDMITVLNNQLRTTTVAHERALQEAESVATVMADAHRLREQLSEASPTDAGSSADQLTLMLLQMKAFGVDGNTPFVLQITGSDIALADSVGEQYDVIMRLIATLELKEIELAQRITELEERLLSEQTEYQAASFEEDQLVLEQQIATEAHSSLARKAQELASTTQNASSNVRVASRASVPEASIARGRRQTLVIAAAALVGMFLAALAVIALTIYREATEA